MDNLACNEEHSDLLLGGQGDRLKGRNVGADHEEMWILRQCRDLRIGQIVAVERRAVGQVSRAQNRRAVRVGDALVSLRDLIDDSLGRHAWKWSLPDMRRVRDRIAGAPNPLRGL